MDRTNSKIDTPVTRGCSAPVLPESSISRRVRGFAEMGFIGVPPPRTITLEEIERRREEEQLQTNEVYFLYCCNRIKIGTSRNHVRRVLKDILPYCVAPLKVIGVIPGGTIHEGRLHQRFQAHAIRDEWFWLGPDLRTFLCEDETRADRLDDAEEDYRNWLIDENINLENDNGNSRD